MRGATLSRAQLARQIAISIHAPREGSDRPELVQPLELQSISIHAPREGSDVPRGCCVSVSVKFLSTLPARGATVFTPLETQVLEVFLSTLPARGATVPSFRYKECVVISIHAPREGSDAKLSGTGSSLTGDFYPRSPRGERLANIDLYGIYGDISIHAPREGSDSAKRRAIDPKTGFLSTLPARGATLRRGTGEGRPGISIHAPREGSDARPPG